MKRITESDSLNRMTGYFNKDFKWLKNRIDLLNLPLRNVSCY